MHPGPPPLFPKEISVAHPYDTLIERVRSLVGDTGLTPAYSDDQIVVALNERREEVRYMDLDALETIQPGGAVVYLDFVAHVGFWDDGVELVDASYSPLTPSLSDNLGGRWSFDDPQADVYLTGFTYDVYGACGDLVSSGSGAASALGAGEKIRVTADGTTIEKSSSSSSSDGSSTNVAASFYAKARPRTLSFIRTDENA